jgi:hypothetical protein
MIGGCGGDGDTDIAAIQQALEECSASTMTGMVNALIAIVSVPDVIAGESPTPGFDVNATLSVDPLDPPNTWDFSIVFDTNQNGVPDSAIVGKMTFSDDPTDGLDPLGTVQIDFTVQNSPIVAGAPVENGTVTGSGDITATLGASTEQVAITGTISLTDTAGGGCDATLTFPVATPLNLDFTDEPAPAGQLAANVGFEIFGTILALIESLGHELDAVITLVDGDQTVFVEGTIDDIDVDFDFELLPSDLVLSQLYGCLIFAGEWPSFLTDVYDQILDAVLGGTPPAGVVVTPTANPDIFNYTVDLAAFDPTNFTAGTITGQVTLVFPVVTSLSGLPPNEALVTWTIAGASFDSGDVANGQNTTGRPLRLRLDTLGNVLSFSGAGTITTTFVTPPLSGITPPAECVMGFDIPENAALAADESDGTLILSVTVGEDVMTAVIDFGEEEIVLTINGLWYPFLIAV